MTALHEDAKNPSYLISQCIAAVIVIAQKVLVGGDGDGAKCNNIPCAANLGQGREPGTVHCHHGSAMCGIVATGPAFSIQRHFTRPKALTPRRPTRMKHDKLPNPPSQPIASLSTRSASPGRGSSLLCSLFILQSWNPQLPLQ
ncbi:LOW QUALITY PROTEIN: hypothetical protein BC936DRAFT_147128 [Jimgerdemannia flammicorona]|uniref:Uncharacterized protein n=1 Tax=Jimgerdemannia flammicorona TaxID=994334 RepID=A0A433D636_9FUNG|nr:LOW QUALITY PROTEIN: hypothetical protein BC936DRAFT_147128 [Jimgerdemannia flammicorona]